MAALKHYNNQLLFNLGVPTMPTNMAVKFARPEPIIFERFAGPGSSGMPVRSVTPNQTAMQFSAVSEDSLSMAVQLARRDIKKRKEEESMRASQELNRRKGKGCIGSPSGKTKIQHSKEYRERLKRKQERDTDRRVVVERERTKNARNSTTQTRRPSEKAPTRNTVYARQDITTMPAMSMSPPTRDVDSGGDKDTQVMREITRLRKEMETCMRQIKDIEKTTQTGLPAQKPVFAEDIEEEKKRATRTEEHASRSARTVYMLVQQVRQIQEDINKLGPGPIKHTKKSQTLSKIAAAHRGAVRALQTFVQHLPDCKTQEGLPRSYGDLAALIRQLSLCCAQLEVAGQAQVPDSVMHLLKDYQDLRKMVDDKVTASPKSPPRPYHQQRQQQQQLQQQKKKSPASRQLTFEATEPSSKQGPVSKQYLEVQERERYPRVESKAAQPRPTRAVDTTPDRQSALRAGIVALMRAADTAPATPRSPRRAQPVRPEVPPLDLPVTPRSPKVRGPTAGVAWDVPLERKQGLLLPAKLQNKRQRVPRARCAARETRYDGPTVSSKLKQTQAHEWPQPASPRAPRKQGYPGSPGRSDSSDRLDSPGRRVRSAPSSPVTSTRQDIARQILLDRQSARQKAISQVQRGKIEKLRKELGKPEEWVADAENRIRDKLQPLLDQAQDIFEAYETVSRTNQHCLRQRLSQRAIDSVEVNADLLADIILQETLEDTAREMRMLQEDEEAQEQAMVMQDTPDLGTMIRRMGEMELEQEEIGRKWGTIEYEDDSSGRPTGARYFDVARHDNPSTPPPLEVTRTSGPQTSVVAADRAPQPSRPESPILFTKASSRSIFEGPLHLTQQEDHLTRPPMDPQALRSRVQRKHKINVGLSQQEVDNIEQYRSGFEDHLKLTAHQSLGRFNPWQIVEEVSDAILKECVDDVSKELDQINSDIINHVYTAEFEQVPDQASSEQPMIFQLTPSRTAHASDVLGRGSAAIAPSAQRHPPADEPHGMASGVDRRSEALPDGEVKVATSPKSTRRPDKAPSIISPRSVSTRSPSPTPRSDSSPTPPPRPSRRRKQKAAVPQRSRSLSASPDNDGVYSSSFQSPSPTPRSGRRSPSPISSFRADSGDYSDI